MRLLYKSLRLGMAGTSNRQMSSNIVPVAEVRRFGIDCLRAASAPLDHATMLSDVLVAADYRGHYSHGMNRLGMCNQR